MTNILPLLLRGATSRTGTRFVEFRRQGQPAMLLPLADCSPALVVEKLAKRGMPLPDKIAINRIGQQLAELDDFPVAPLLDHAGWTDGSYALPGGRVVAASGAERMESAFKTVPDPLKVTGMLEDWRDDVAAPITGQTLPMFAVMLALAGPVLDILKWDHSPIFELVAPANVGTSLLHGLAASVAGTVAQELIGLAELFADLDHHRAQHAGRTMLIGDPRLALAGATPQKMATAVRDTIVGLSAGAKLPADGRSTSSASRGICLITSQVSLVEYFGAEGEVGSILQERITTLRVSEKWLLAIFNIRRGGHNALDRLAEELREAVGQYQGTAFRQFIAKLVQDRADDEAALKARLEHYRRTFLRKSGIKRNDRRSRRYADDFALVYAAGTLARSYEILPATWQIGPAVLDCFAKHQATRAAPNPYLAQLEAIAVRPDTLHLKKGQEVDPAIIGVTKAFVRQFSNRRELIIRPEATGELIRDWNEMKPPMGLAILIKKDGNHLGVKVRLPGGSGQTRMHVFRLPKEPPSPV